MAYVYHYYAIRHLRSGAIEHSDGIAYLSYEITDQEQYRRLKKLIEPEAHGEITIASLSLLRVTGSSQQDNAEG